MSTISGTNYNDYLYGTNYNDVMYGFNGNDVLSGGNGNDQTIGGNGNDWLYGGNGNDVLWGGAGNDVLSGGNGNDQIIGGTDVDYLYGGYGADKFYFYAQDTGDKYLGKADTIYDFDSSDTIAIQGYHSYAGSTSAPGDGQYGIWKSGSDWVVTYNNSGDSGFHDVVVKGADPHGHVSYFV